MKATEWIVSENPFVVRREVRWGDCDPAGVVYTGKYTDYLLGAVALYTEFLGQGQRLGEAHGVGTPCKAMSFEFIGTLWPGDIIDIECTIGQIRTKSFDIHIFARHPDAREVFKAVFSPICVFPDRRLGTAIPATLREVLVHAASKNTDPH